MGMMDSAGKTMAGGFMCMWLLFWSSIVMVFNFFCVNNLIMQQRAYSFPTTTGSITHSAVIPGDSDSSPRPDVKFEYFVGKQKLEGSEVRFGGMHSSMDDADEIVARYPVGSETKVYYEANRPTNSALEIGWATMDFFMPLFLMPFNMVMIGGWYVALGNFVRRRIGLPPQSVQVRHDGIRQHYRVFKEDPVLVVFMAVGLTAFAATFVVAFVGMIVPRLPLLVVAWLAVVGMAVWSWLRCKPNFIDVDLSNGKLCTTIDGHERTLDARDVRKIKSSGPGKHTRTAQAKLTIKPRDGEKIVIPCNDRASGEWLKEQLETELRLPA